MHFIAYFTLKCTLIILNTLRDGFISQLWGESEVCDFFLAYFTLQCTTVLYLGGNQMY